MQQNQVSTQESYDIKIFTWFWSNKLLKTFPFLLKLFIALHNISLNMLHCFELYTMLILFPLALHFPKRVTVSWAPCLSDQRVHCLCLLRRHSCCCPRCGLTSPCTVLSADFFIFVFWKVAVHWVHNLRPCTGFLFPVHSRTYYGLYTIYFFTYKCTDHFRWWFLCAVKLQLICRNSVILSYIVGGL